MYSVVLMMALSGGTEAVDHRRCHGCAGSACHGTVVVSHGCTGGGHGCFTYDVGTNVQLECFGDNGVHQALATTLACATPDYIQPPSGKHWADPEVTPQMLSVAGAHSCALSSSGAAGRSAS